MMGDSLSPFGIAAIVASLGFVAAGIVMPEAAEALLRLLLAALAVGFVVARSYQARLPERMTQHVYSPFEKRADGRATAAPLPVRELAAQVAVADTPRKARRAEIPRTVRWKLIDEASRRLSHHHGLGIGEAADHAAIRSMVSGATWSLLQPEAAARSGAASDAESARRGFVTVSQLDLIIDDLERL